MPIIVPPGHALVKVLLRQADTGRRCSNSYGVELSGPIVAANVASLSSALAAAYKPVMHTGSVFDGIHIIEGQDGPPLVWDSTSGTGAGTRTVTNRTSPQVQFLLDKKTALGGRKYRGRTFLFDVGETDVDATGAVAGATITLLATFAAAVLSALSTIGPFSGMELLHGDSTVPTDVTSFAPDPLVATLRGRFPR